MKTKILFLFFILLLPLTVNTLELSDNTDKVKIESSVKIEYENNALKIYSFYDSYLKLRDYNTHTYLRQSDNTINLKYPDYETKIYEIDTFLGKGIEYLIIYNSKPTTNIFELEIKSNDCTFYYQDSLIKENKIKGNYGNETHLYNATGSLIAHRPKSILYSYAIYRGSSKLFHILRPLAYDSNNQQVWCDMILEGDNLKFTIPQLFLDNAVYPVYLDPSVIGKTTIGGSTFTFADDTIYGSLFNLTLDGNFTSVSVYTTGTHRDGWAGIYNITNTEGDYTPYGLEGETEHEWSTQGWHTWHFTSETIVNASWIWLVGYQTLYDKTGYYDTATNQTFSYYDAGIGNFPTTLTDWNVYFYDYVISIYANYTAFEEPEPPEPEPTAYSQQIGSIVALPLNFIFYVVMLTLSIYLNLKSRYLGKIISIFIFAFLTIFIIEDTLFNTHIWFTSGFVNNSYTYNATIQTITTPLNVMFIWFNVIITAIFTIVFFNTVIQLRRSRNLEA